MIVNINSAKMTRGMYSTSQVAISVGSRAATPRAARSYSRRQPWRTPLGLAGRAVDPEIPASRLQARGTSYGDDALLARLARVLKEAVNFEATPRLDRVSVNVGWSFLRSWGGLDRVTVNVNSSFL